MQWGDDMERLTRRDSDGQAYAIIGYTKKYGEAIDKLAEYEEAEEQGLLLRLPCKVGDVLWCTDNKKTESFIVKEFKICAYKINRVEIYFENASGFGLCLFDGTLDEGWFLTKEAAEQALAKMKEV